MEAVQVMEEKILKYLKDSSHLWIEIVAHRGFQFGPARKALDNLEAEGKVRYDVERGLYVAAR